MQTGRYRLGLENRRSSAHICGMASGIWTTEYFTCPGCELDYAATKELHSSRHSGRFECRICQAEVHAWSGLHDFFDWKAQTVKSPVFGKKHQQRRAAPPTPTDVEPVQAAFAFLPEPDMAGVNETDEAATADS